MSEQSSGGIDQWTARIHCGDSFDVLAELPEVAVHAVVCDPPYGLNFMGRDWDNFRRRNNDADVGRDDVGGRLSAKAPASGAETDMKEYQRWCEQWARLAFDVLKPGGHLLAFSGNRTHHRLFSGVEDAGFEIRDCITWHYGEGFPKALDVSKAIDDAAGAEREAVGTYTNPRTGESHEYPHESGVKTCYGEDNRDGESAREVTAPATDAAREWDEWKTCLKPATEFVVVARKPFDGTVAENVLEHGTAALNIGGTRIGTDSRPKRVNRDTDPDANTYGEYENRGSEAVGETTEGRYPANVVMDEAAARMLDVQSGELSAGHHTGEDTNGFGESRDYDGPGDYTETGGASRYYKTVSWSDADLELARFCYTSKASRAERTLDGRIANAHPTVKPVDLMEWLVKLVTAEGQIVLDPFAGTGTTCMAAKNLNRRFVGVEKQAKWADVARVRCGLAPEDPARVRPDDSPQSGLEAYADGGAPSDD